MLFFGPGADGRCCRTSCENQHYPDSGKKNVLSTSPCSVEPSVNTKYSASKGADEIFFTTYSVLSRPDPSATGLRLTPGAQARDTLQKQSAPLPAIHTARPRNRELSKRSHSPIYRRECRVGRPPAAGHPHDLEEGPVSRLVVDLSVRRRTHCDAHGRLLSETAGIRVAELMSTGSVRLRRRPLRHSAVNHATHQQVTTLSY
ncbi:DUF6342 family protein [Microbispora oryzae]|uniref:DUF6342 family protein n=1 Tax=Microbispora oryzae TaxID=2806554 RepID=UPI00355834CA